MQYSFKKISFLLGIFLVFFLILQVILFVALFHNKSKTTQQTTSPSSQPTGVSSIIHAYTLVLPTSWTLQQNTNPSDATKRYTFTVDNTPYSFQSFPRGSITASTDGADTLVDEAKIFQGRQFLIRTYLKNSQPILVVALPNEADLSIDGFMMVLPPTNTQKYITQFEQILQTMQLSTPAPLTPFPSLISSSRSPLSQ